MMTHTRRYKRVILFFKSLLYLIVVLSIFLGIIFLNFYFKVRNININFFNEDVENIEIKKYTEKLIQNSARNFINYIILSEEDLTNKIHKEFPTVSTVKISKNFTLDLNVVVTKNEEFFYTCMGNESGFLVRCMLGNTDGEFYQEVDPGEFLNASTSKLEIEINQEVLYDALTSKKLDRPDSLAGSRVFTGENFSVLREFIKFLLNNGFTIKKIELNELEIATIYTGTYIIKISLEKGYVETIKDFELISRQGKLEKYINGDKEKINYIDLSFKNKVFYKLHGAGNKKETNASTTSTTTNATTTN